MACCLVCLQILSLVCWINVKLDRTLVSFRQQELCNSVPDLGTESASLDPEVGCSLVRGVLIHYAREIGQLGEAEHLRRIRREFLDTSCILSLCKQTGNATEYFYQMARREESSGSTCFLIGRTFQTGIKIVDGNGGSLASGVQ